MIYMSLLHFPFHYSIKTYKTFLCPDRLKEAEKEELIQILEEYRVSVKESNGTKAMQRLASLHMLLHHLGKYKAMEAEQRFIALEEIKNFHNITLEGSYTDGIRSYGASFGQ